MKPNVYIRPLRLLCFSIDGITNLREWRRDFKIADTRAKILQVIYSDTPG